MEGYLTIEDCQRLVRLGHNVTPVESHSDGRIKTLRVATDKGPFEISHGDRQYTILFLVIEFLRSIPSNHRAVLQPGEPLDSSGAVAELPHSPRPSKEDRYLNAALINIGEAVSTIGNLRQRGVVPGKGCTEAKLALLRAIADLDGVPWIAPPDQMT